MQPTHLLVVERDADWSQWSRISRSFGSTVVMLIQRADEALGAFYQRIQRCLEERSIQEVTVMRAAGEYSGKLLFLLSELGISMRDGMNAFEPRAAPG